MNKFILITTFLFVTSANAEYLIHIPLEQDNGGFLPNNSIIIVSEVTPPVNETPGQEETGCKYDIYYAGSETDTNEYLWIRSINTTTGIYTDQIYWEVKIFENTSYSTTPINEYLIDGYRYTFQGTSRFNYSAVGSNFQEFEICKSHS